ncbi:recombinase family protein [[Clostridium] colinum]|uniref:recombinase family protein n=1 Tax=[Clostridium] colinum TaxID=36835 RepID=UPI002025089E|nr:recombinase family protein [[Clostridium] colinum]
MSRKNKINRNIYKVAFYIRISVEDEFNNSIENQEILLQNYIKNKENFKLIDTYIDNGLTGTNFERKRFEDLICDINKNKINCIIVKDLSRFGRNYIETGKYLEEVFPKKNIRFISINDNYDSINNDCFDILNLHIKNIVNDMYSKDISKKICSSLKAKQLNGDFIGSIAPFGYKKSKKNKYQLEIDKNVCNTIKIIFDLRIKGNSYLSIARKLNEQKISCPNKYKFENGILFDEKYKSCIWTESTIKKILKNQVYIGHTIQGTKRKELFNNKNIKYVSKDNLIIIYNTHAPIIGKETFSKVQNINTNNRKKYKNSINNIYKKSINTYRNVLKCGECGANLYLINKSKSYYKCTKNKIDNNICNFKKIYKNDIDEIIFTYFKTEINYLNIKFNNQCEKLKTYNKTLNYFKLQLKNFSKYYEKIYTQFLEGILSKNDYIHIKKKYQEKEKHLLIKYNLIKNEYEKLNNSYIDNFNLQDKSILTEYLINNFIKKILVYNNNRFEIFFNFKGDL